MENRCPHKFILSVTDLYHQDWLYHKHKVLGEIFFKNIQIINSRHKSIFLRDTYKENFFFDHWSKLIWYILLFTLKLQSWMDFTFSKATHKGQNKQKSCYHVCGLMSTMLMSRIFQAFYTFLLFIWLIIQCLASLKTKEYLKNNFLTVQTFSCNCHARFIWNSLAVLSLTRGSKVGTIKVLKNIR